MDFDNLPEGLYYDPVHGIIEDFRNVKHASDSPTSNDGEIVFVEDPAGLGIVDADYDIDDAENQYLAVALANPHNANNRYVRFFSAPPDSYQFMPIPGAPEWTPRIKIDFVKLKCVGRKLICHVVEHAPQVAPRPSYVEQRKYSDVCVVIPPYTPPVPATYGPCVPPGNLPYFRPNNTLTRGQVSKMIVLALEGAGLVLNDIPEAQQSFQDIAVGSTYYEYIEKLHALGAIGGYDCRVPPPAPKP